MAKQTRPVVKVRSESEILPLTRINYIILVVGLILIIAGYVALSQKPWDGFFPLVIAPILLVAGYCVVIPIGILYRGKHEKRPEVN